MHIKKIKMKCKAFLIADSIDTKSLPSERQFRDASLLRAGKNIFFVFPFGAIVAWGDGGISDALLLLKDYMTNPYTQERFITDLFEVDNSSESNKLIFQDTIYLKGLADDDLIKLSLSHSIAQSMRLNHLEDLILESIKRISHVPQDLASHGKIKEGKVEISKMQGHLYLLKSKISWEHSVLDTPEFFWEYPEYDEYYHKMNHYLELAPRLEILNHKTASIDEILSILSNELNHRHSSKLEWVIIWLIMFEIIIFFLKDIFKVI